MNDVREFPLDETIRTLVGEYNDQIVTASNGMRGVLNLVCRQNKLEGQWSLSPDGTKLIRIDQPQPQAAFTKTNGTPRKK